MRLLATALLLLAPAIIPRLSSRASSAPDPLVGPATGAVMLVGGGHQDPDVLEEFIALAGGYDAPIVVIPTAAPDSAFDSTHIAVAEFREAGARDVRLLHTRDRRTADALGAMLADARGVWIEGGRQGRLIDAYRGTHVERMLHDVVARGGVVGGTSAGASVLGSTLVRGGTTSNRVILAPGYTRGFALLRGTAIDQHANARARLRDIPDSVLRHDPDLLGIALDEGTALVVRGDDARVVGRGGVYVSGRRVATDSGAPYATLRAGDVYDLGLRRMLATGWDGLGITRRVLDSLVRAAGGSARTRATVVVAGNGSVVTRGYGRLEQGAGHAITAAAFELRGLSALVHRAAVARAVTDGVLSDSATIPGTRITVAAVLADPRRLRGTMPMLAGMIAKRVGISYAGFLSSRFAGPLGMHGTTLASDGWHVTTSADDLLRLTDALRRAGDLALLSPVASAAQPRPAPYGPAQQGSAQPAPARRGPSNALLHEPARKATVIVLSDDRRLDAAALSASIMLHVPILVASR